MTREEAIEVIEQDIPCEHDRDLIEALEMAISALTENKEELTNEKAIAFLQDNGWLVEHDRIMTSGMENKGEWIYDKGIENWRCSKCGQIPPPTGYVGNADFMATYFKFCPTCGADMREPKGEKGTE